MYTCTKGYDVYTQYVYMYLFKVAAVIPKGVGSITLHSSYLHIHVLYSVLKHLYHCIRMATHPHGNTKAHST